MKSSQLYLLFTLTTIDIIWRTQSLHNSCYGAQSKVTHVEVCCTESTMPPLRVSSQCALLFANCGVGQSFSHSFIPVFYQPPTFVQFHKFPSP
jgi:hypothetical protein